MGYTPRDVVKRGGFLSRWVIKGGIDAAWYLDRLGVCG
jgi:hypothetical protein